MLHPVDLLVGGAVPVVRDQRVQAVIHVCLVAHGRNFAARQNEKHRLAAGFLSEEVVLLDQRLPQHHETDLKAVGDFMRQKAVALHDVRGVMCQVVVNLLEGHRIRPTRRVHGNTRKRFDLERGHGDTPSHRWSLPAQSSATARPHGTAQRGEPGK